MTALAPVIARIALRYLGGALLGWGFAAELAEDPDINAVVTMATGAVLSAGAEVWMVLARRCGWAK
jgi:hypothetical protein